MTATIETGEAEPAPGRRLRRELSSTQRIGSRAMGREAAIGTVEKGKIADLIVCGTDPTKDVANLRRLEAVVRGGAFHSLAELHAAASAGVVRTAPTGSSDAGARTSLVGAKE